EDLFDIRLAVSGVGSKSLPHPRYRLSERVPIAPGHDALIIAIGESLDHLHHAAAGEVPVVNAPPVCKERLLRSVPTPVGRHDIQSPVAVEVTRGHAVPPTLILAKPEGLGQFSELAGLIFENPNRSPLASNDELWETIAGEVAE